MDGWMNKWMDRWVDRQVERICVDYIIMYFYLSISPCIPKTNFMY